MDKFAYCAKSFAEFKARLREHEIKTVTKYVFRQSTKSFDEKVILSPKLKLHWLYDIPYFHFGKRRYCCHQGPDFDTAHKKKYLDTRDEKTSDHLFRKRLCSTQVTKKLDCPSSLDVVRAFQMPDFKIIGPVSKKKKDIVSCTIKKMLAENVEVTGQEIYLFNLPEPDSHKFHLMGDAACVTEPIDPRVREKITELVRQGKRNSAVIIELLDSFLEKELLETDRMRRRFYPDKATVRRIISEVKLSIRSTKMDMENTDKMLKQWDTSSCSLFFRPCAVNNNDKTSNVLIDNNVNEEIYDEEAQENKYTEVNHNMLFVYQSNHMKHLYRRYGTNSILLDATYKVCKYAIPLYFLVVRTNVSYQVVGVFITQYETKEALIEALDIIKNWNQDINPRYAMVDFAVEEILAIEEVFKGIKVFICTFHREQAWSRWLSKKEHACIPKDGALERLRKVANATPESLEASINYLKTWKFYSNTPLKKYFEQTWEGEIRRWCQAWKPIDLYFNTNNGVERLNEELKYGYLTDFKNCLLSEIIKILLDNFLPNQYSRYVQKNVKISAQHMKYNASLPNYLHERPAWFVNHMKKKLENVDESLADTVKILEANKFLVPSMTRQTISYVVEFDERKETCRCTCESYLHQRLFCKHILLVGIHDASFSLEKCQSSLLSNPVFKLDDSIVPQVADSEKNSLPSEDLAMEDTITVEDSIMDTHNEYEETVIYGELGLRKKKKKNLIAGCNSAIRSIQSLMYNSDEGVLTDLLGKLNEIIGNLSQKVIVDENTGLPIETVKCTDMKNMNAEQNKEPIPEVKTEILKVYSRLPIHKRKKSAGRVGAWADTLKEARKITIFDQAKKQKVSHVSVNNISDDITGNIDYTEHSMRENRLMLKTKLQNGNEKKEENITGITVSRNEDCSKNIQNESKQHDCIKGKENKWRPSIDSIIAECAKNVFVSDEIIDYAQSLIKDQENTQGLQSTLLGQRLAFDISRNSTQILHNGNNHWVTVRILNHCTVELYDSLGLNPTEYLQRQISSIVFNDITSDISIISRPVQYQQARSNNCGPLAIAFAFYLARGGDPCNVTFDPLSLRSHVEKCLTDGKFTEFPQTKQKLPRVKEKNKTVKVYCVCRLPSFAGEDVIDLGLRMAQCCLCSEWFHQKCDADKLTDNVFTNRKCIYKCQNCRLKKPN